MKQNIEDLLRKSFGNVIALLGYVSTASTFLPWHFMQYARPYLRPLGVVLIILGLFRGALKMASDKDELRNADMQSWNKERDQLTSDLFESRRDKFSESLRTKVEQYLRELNQEELAAVRTFCIKESWEDRQLDPSIPMEHFRSARSKGMKFTLIETDDDRWALTKKTYWRIVPAYLQPLRVILMESKNTEGKSTSSGL